MTIFYVQTLLKQWNEISKKLFEIDNKWTKSYTKYFGQNGIHDIPSKRLYKNKVGYAE